MYTNKSKLINVSKYINKEYKEIKVYKDISQTIIISLDQVY